MRPTIKNYRSGYASNEGNGMVGGAWWGCEHLAHAEAYVTDFIELPDEESIMSRWPKINDWFMEKDKVVIEAYIEIGEDNSTNYSSCDVDEVFYPEEFDERVNACPYLSEQEKQDTIKKFREFVDRLDTEDFEFYDADYPDCED